MVNNKFWFYKNCIFCGNELPNPQLRLKKDCEHVFPKNIFGFWKSRDVCSECVKYFGKKVDKLPLKNSEIIEAMKILGLSDKNYIEGQKFEGEDLFNRSKVPFVVDKNKPRIKYINTSNFLQISEEKVDSLGFNWIRNNANKGLDNKIRDEEIIRLEEKYKKAEFGETVNSSILGISVRKTQAEIKEAENNSEALHKLVAKIAIIFLNYALSAREISFIKEYNKIKDFAKGKADIIENTIYRSKLYNDNNFKKYHVVRIEIYGRFIILNVIFFGRISYSLPLISCEKINLKVDFEDEPLKGLALVLDFEGKYKLFIEYKKQNDDRVNYEIIM